jgi:hypothetical protein
VRQVLVNTNPASGRLFRRKYAPLLDRNTHRLKVVSRDDAPVDVDQLSGIDLQILAVHFRIDIVLPTWLQPWEVVD